MLENNGLIPISVQVKNIETGEIETISLPAHESQHVLGPPDHISDGSLDTLNMLLYVKDPYNISGSPYHELASICKGLPKHYTIKQRIRELNRKWNIQSTHNGIVGVQLSLEDGRLCVRVCQLLRSSDETTEFRQKKELHVKLTGDGTCIGKRLHVVTSAFSLLEEESKAHSFEGNHILAVFRAPEDYDSLENALSDIRDEVPKPIKRERKKNRTLSGIRTRVVVLTDSESNHSSMGARSHRTDCAQTHIHTCTFLWRAKKDGGDSRGVCVLLGEHG